MNDECVENNTEDEDTWTVEIEIEDVGTSELNTTKLLTIISEVSGIDQDKLNIGTEVNNQGEVIRIFVYVNDANNAEIIASKIKAIDKGDDCEYEALCNSKDVKISGDHNRILIVSKSSHTVVKFYYIIMSILIVMITFIILG